MNIECVKKTPLIRIPHNLEKFWSLLNLKSTVITRPGSKGERSGLGASVLSTARLHVAHGQVKSTKLCIERTVHLQEN